MPIPLHERGRSRGFEKGKFDGGPSVSLFLENCEEIAALFYLRINQGNWSGLLDRVGFVG
jgi:hypothetical protein